MICLDSTAVIDYLKGETKVVQALEEHEQEGFCLTEFVIFEVARGVMFSQKSKGPKILDEFIDFISQYNILPSMNLFAMDAAHISANLYTRGKPIGSTDCLIAGTMQANGISKILTRNKKDFTKIPGIQVIAY